MSATSAASPSPVPGPLVAWVAASRPATLTASVAPVAVGTSLAYADGGFAPLAALMALLGAFFIQIGTNLFNDLSDFRKGADTEDRLGPARAVQKGWLSQREVAVGTAVTFGLATACGVYLVVVGGWPVVAIGVTSVLSGLAYTGGPKPLAYVGMGDVFVVLFFGLVAVSGTYYVQTGELTWLVMLVSLPVGWLATAILAVNNLRDRHTDARVGKRTLAVRFGARFARAEYLAMVGGSYLLMLGLAAATSRWGLLLPLLTVPGGVRLVRKVYTLDGAALNPLLGATAKLGLIFALLVSAGVAL